MSQNQRMGYKQAKKKSTVLMAKMNVIDHLREQKARVHGILDNERSQTGNGQYGIFVGSKSVKCGYTELVLGKFTEKIHIILILLGRYLIYIIRFQKS